VDRLTSSETNAKRLNLSNERLKLIQALKSRLER
jgi:hypothetical protein